jgi:hypothetical protein
MKVGSVDNTALRGQAGPRLTVDIESSGRAVTFRYASAPQSDRIAFEASEELGHEGDAALILGLLPAMKLGFPIRVAWDVSPRLLGGLGPVQLVFRHWDQSLKEIPIEAESGPLPQSQGDRVGAFFSGGVDSFYTALKYRAEITDLIHVTGFDLPLSKHPELHERVGATAREVAKELGKNLVEVRAELRPFCYEYVGWPQYNGLALAAIALLLQDRFRAVHVPASMSLSGIYDGMTPHPLIDPLLGTECTQIVSSGVETDRFDKVAFLADSDLAMSKLRVCWETPSGEYNCGACGKCLRTMISLQIVGALERCRTLPDRLDLAAVRRTPLPETAGKIFTRENLRALEARGDDRRLTRAVRTSLRRADRELRRKNRRLVAAGRR